MSSSYHPQMNGSSERTNKTVNQALQYHVDRNQKDWVCALPIICFNMMNMVNKSTGFSPFQLRLGQSPRILPPLTPGLPTTSTSATEVIHRLQDNTAEAQDNLLKAKITQLIHSNKGHPCYYFFNY
jgi:hypothetical protein